tara:strand:- start:684 stop:836 length:153 start_codon:yes stop_codon:yes gene_type:complete
MENVSDFMKIKSMMEWQLNENQGGNKKKDNLYVFFTLFVSLYQSLSFIAA